MKRLPAAICLAFLLMTGFGFSLTGRDISRVEAITRNTVLSGRVTTGFLNVYAKEGSMDSIVLTLRYNDRVQILTTGSQWVRIRSGKIEGYVIGKYLQTIYGGNASDEGGYSKGQQVANYALQYVGNPYVWGGESLTNGADCSGFVMCVYRHFGKFLPHSSYAQRNYGKEVGSLSLARPGDIICYDGHVAIYLGNRRIVHASSRRTGIKVSNNAAYRHIVSIRRLF
jgi:hypothetical protein